MIRASQFSAFRYGSRKPYVSTETRATELLAFIVAYQADHGGVSPSYPDMMAGTGFASKSSVHRTMHHLIATRKIRTLPDRARAIEVLAQVVPDEDHRPARPFVDTRGWQAYVVVKAPGEDARIVPMEGGKG